MNDSLLILFLQIIKNNGNVKTLLEYGYDFAQISRHIKQLKLEYYIESYRDHLRLTYKGEEKLILLNSKLNRTGSGKWISPQENFKIEKIGIYDVYLP